MVYIDIKMETNMKDNLKMIKNQDLPNYFWQIEKKYPDFGVKIFSKLIVIYQKFHSKTSQKTD